MGKPLFRTALIAIAIPVLASAGVSVGRASESESAAGSAKMCTNLSRTCVIEVARTYVDGVAQRKMNSPAIRYAKTVERFENGTLALDGAPDVNPQSAGEGNVAHAVGAASLGGWEARDLGRIWVDGNEAFFRYELDIKDAKTGAFTSTSHIFERVKVEKGVQCAYGLPEPCITEIELVFCNAPHAKESPFPTRDTPKYDFGCDRKG